MVDLPKRNNPPELPKRNNPPALPNREIVLPKGSAETVIITIDSSCGLPSQKPKEEYVLTNSTLIKEQYHRIMNTNRREYYIKYSGDFIRLRQLIEQLATIREKEINLNLGDIEVNDTIYLPFGKLGSNVYISFGNEPDLQSNFHTYLINSGSTLDEISKNIDDKKREELFGEREIMENFVEELLEAIHRRGKRLSDYSNDQLMDLVFNYVRKNFPYDWSIVDPKTGKLLTSCMGVANSAYKTYKRGKGVCNGRSKLIKLLANNKYLNLPCYLITGMSGNLDHYWNEYVNDHGQIMEYDSSYGRKVILSRLPSSYKIEYHEPAIRKLLKK